MAIMNYFKNLLKSPESQTKEVEHVRMLNGEIPVFTQYGEDVYYSDLVNLCIRIAATEISKLQPRHIRTDDKGFQTIPKSSLNRLFKFAPNEMMTTKDFLERVVWILYKKENAFIYPTYEIRDNKTYYTGFYPLNPLSIKFLQDVTNTLYVEFTFGGGYKFKTKYKDVIHIRKNFGSNDLMGGLNNGEPDNRELLKTLKTSDKLTQGIDKAITTSLTVRGIMKVNTMMEDENQEKKRQEFEEKMNNSKSGIVPMDIKSDYIDLKPNPKIIDKDTLEFLDNKVLRRYGTSLPILTGDFNDDQYQAYYEKELEPIVISFHQAFSKTIFTERELDMGNEISFFQRDMNYLSTKSKLDLIKIMGEQGLLQDNQKLALLGYPPIEGGERITQSLNYIDKAIINTYQLSKKETMKGDEGNV